MLALKSWSAFVQKENRPGNANECDEDDPELLAALDEAIRQADATPGAGKSADEVIARIREWTSR
jgi:hypothetical protein